MSFKIRAKNYIVRYISFTQFKLSTNLHHIKTIFFLISPTNGAVSSAIINFPLKTNNFGSV